MARTFSYDAPAKCYYVFDPDLPEIAPVTVTVAEVLNRIPAEERDSYIATYAPITDNLVLAIGAEKLDDMLPPPVDPFEG
jgi:hypothetical protein